MRKLVTIFQYDEAHDRLDSELGLFLVFVTFDLDKNNKKIKIIKAKKKEIKTKINKMNKV